MSVGRPCGTGVGHGAVAQVLDQVLQFAAGERVVGLHRMTADGLGHGMLAQPQGIEFPPGGLEFVHQFEHEPAGVGGLHKGRQGIEQEGALAEFAQANP